VLPRDYQSTRFAKDREAPTVRPRDARAGLTVPPEQA